MKRSSLIICSAILFIAILNLAQKNIDTMNYFIVWCCYAAIIAFAVRDYKKNKEVES